MEQTMVRGPRSGWREDEIDQLWREIQRANASGQPLRSVFEALPAKAPSGLRARTRRRCAIRLPSRRARWAIPMCSAC